jgi:hypothetical protein
MSSESSSEIAAAIQGLRPHFSSAKEQTSIPGLAT